MRDAAAASEEAAAAAARELSEARRELSLQRSSREQGSSEWDKERARLHGLLKEARAEAGQRQASIEQAMTSATGRLEGRVREAEERASAAREQMEGAAAAARQREAVL